MKIRLAIITALFAMFCFTGTAWAAKDAPNDNASDTAKERSHGQQGKAMSSKEDDSAGDTVVIEGGTAPAEENNQLQFFM